MFGSRHDDGGCMCDHCQGIVWARSPGGPVDVEKVVKDVSKAGRRSSKYMDEAVLRYFREIDKGLY
jgi:hypothetical protein